MLRLLPVYCRALSTGLVLCLTLGFPHPVFSQSAAPPPQAGPSTQPQKKGEQPTSTHPAPQTTETRAPAPAGATLKGKLTGTDRKSPLAGAQVHAISKNGKVISSAPADSKGRYTLAGVPPGTYRIAISTDEGVYSLETEVGITSPSVFTMDLATVPAEAARGTVPGLDRQAVGFATILQGKRKAGGGSFWGSARGIVLLAASAGAVALILAHADKNAKEEPVSPSLP